MELPTQHDPMLATMPPELLPPPLIHPSNQKCQILPGTCSEITMKTAVFKAQRVKISIRYGK